MYNQKYILEFISCLLGKNFSQNEFEKYLPINESFCEKLVIISSNHLVIPSIYISIIDKNLESHFPEKLIHYFKQISDLNYERNCMIYEQISSISNLFMDKFDFVFTKGSSLLIYDFDYFKYRRMIGDIDILIDKNYLITAREILKKNHYTNKTNNDDLISDDDKYIDNKHLTRLINKNNICAVELHKHILDSRHSNQINPQEILKNKRKYKNHFIPSNYHMWKISILNWQCNDYGYANNFLNFRSLNDTLFLEPPNVNSILLTQNKKIKHYYTLVSVFFADYPSFFPVKKLFYFIQLRFPKVFKAKKIFVKIKIILSVSFNRFSLMFYQKKYKNKIIKNPKIIINKVLGLWRKLP